jgi:LacI family transcriptional regulator/LacI family repressor for deo operon, udp, cdd, tsx, nupC, and nupG
MKQRTISIEDIAEAAGVSHSTVSRALRDSPLISADVRERIQHLADELGYVPNAIAQSLQTQRTNTIGLVVTSIADPFLGDVVKGVEGVAQRAGLSLIFSTSQNDPQQELVVIESFHRRRVDGILVAASRISSHHAPQLMRMRIPTVLISSQAEEPSPLLHSVAVDDYSGARRAVEYLVQLGHRSIGYLGVGNRPQSNRRRLEAYRDALAAAGVAQHDAWIVIAPSEDELHEDDVAAGQTLLPPLLAAGVTAVFCYNDMVAVGVLLSCRDHGIAVPQQLSVIGFDDIPVAQYVSPPLTTIHQPKLELGRAATHMLLQLLDGQTVQDRILTPVLVPRASASAPPRR